MVQFKDNRDKFAPTLRQGGDDFAPSVRAGSTPTQVRVRETTDDDLQADLWTPAQLGPDLALWLDVWHSDFDLRTDNGTQYVERWGDLSGNGNDATQETGAQQPINSDTIIFDGNDDYLALPPTVSGSVDRTVLL